MVEWGRERSRARTWPVMAGREGYSSVHDWLRFQLARFVEVAKGLVAAEAAKQQVFPWIAVAFGAGIAIYFAALREPVIWIVPPVALVACGIALAARRTRAFVPLVLTAAMLSGFAVATIKTARIAHPVLTRPILFASLTGFVEVREERERTDRFVLRVDKLETLRAADAIKLERVRLSVKKGTAPAVGSYVELKARLSPPFSATRPGGYDFAREEGGKRGPFLDRRARNQ